MADIFLTKDVRMLLEGKRVMFLGDSNMRAIYKDLLCLHTHPRLIRESVLKSKMEKSCFGDILVEHGEKTNGRDYKEHRLFTYKKSRFSFCFLTRVYSQYMEKIIESFNSDGCPDVIVINSCLWDICRWGPHGVEEYRKNLKVLMKRFKETLDSKCLVIWLTTLPISQEVKGGFLIVQLEFLKLSLRFHVVEANHYARQVVMGSGYDILDGHYHLRMQLQQRAPDGIHWLPCAVRHLTNLLLTHMSIAWGVKLPGRYKSSITERVQNLQEPSTSELAYDEPDINENMKRIRDDDGEQESKSLKSEVCIAMEQSEAKSNKEKSRKDVLKDIKNIQTSTKGLHSKVCETPSQNQKKKKANKFRRYESRQRRMAAQQRIRKYLLSNPQMPSPVVEPFNSPLGSPVRFIRPSSMSSPDCMPHVYSPHLTYSPPSHLPRVREPLLARAPDHIPCSPVHYPYFSSYLPHSHVTPHYNVDCRTPSRGYDFNYEPGRPLLPRCDWVDVRHPIRFGDY